ncbi:hypothetical protein [Bacillus mycoides]|uniref:hypothetical protein n=1 Tax=Bacillus mycoides TaxID=1405 RepID=UPI0010BE714C|nr:hypothetical protein [Bacillus mycoides]TKI45579.1 hypothetical protein FC700_10420 [Bacillus mycoides]
MEDKDCIYYHVVADVLINDPNTGNSVPNGECVENTIVLGKNLSLFEELEYLLEWIRNKSNYEDNNCGIKLVQTIRENEFGIKFDMLPIIEVKAEKLVQGIQENGYGVEFNPLPNLKRGLEKFGEDLECAEEKIHKDFKALIEKCNIR